MALASDFYLRYYVGHKGKFGHEFLEFEFRPDGERRRGCEGGRAAQAMGFCVFFFSPFLISIYLLVLSQGLV